MSVRETSIRMTWPLDKSKLMPNEPSSSGSTPRSLTGKYIAGVRDIGGSLREKIVPGRKRIVAGFG